MFSSLLNTQTPVAGPSSHSASTMQRSVSDVPFVDDEYDYGGGEPEDEADESMFRDMTFDEVLEDLNARFLVNLPEEERPLVRLYWQAEQAHWFYEDYLRPLNPHLPSLGQRHFTQLIIASSPLFASLAGPNGIDYDGVWNDYIAYKSMVPCCGAIILNKEGDKCLVVRGWKSSAGWSFPRGKININEPEMLCAIREVEEETGFDLAGLINERDRIQTQVNSQSVTMYIVVGVDESTIFEAQTKKEIGAIEWVKNTELPTWTGKKPKKAGGVKEKKFYNVTPFVGPLKKWLQQHGYNPHPSTKKKQPQPQPQKVHQDNRRNLQPFFEESSHIIHAAIPPAQSSQHTQDQAASALDHLFDRFITKQEEDLRTDTAEAVMGTDQKEGMERLFGDMGIPASHTTSLETEKTLAGQREEAKRNDEDLVRLLGGISVEPSAAPPSAKANRLLSLLKSTTRSEGAPPPVQQAESGHTGAVAPMMKPHQASLLSMLSPAARAPLAAPTADVNTQSHFSPSALPHPSVNPVFSGNTHHNSTDNSPAPSTDSEMARRDKQRQLLEMTIAGMSLGATPPATNHPNLGLPGAPIGQAQSHSLQHQSFSTPQHSGQNVYPSRSPQKSADPTPNGSHTARSTLPPPHHPSQQSPTRRHNPPTSSTSSPNRSGSSGPPPGTDGSTVYPTQHPHQQQNRQQPGQVSSEQQRLLAALQGRPQPPPMGGPVQSGPPGGFGYARQPHGPGGPAPPGPGRGAMYQMGVPGQPGQPMQSNLTTNQFPPPLPPNHMFTNQPGGSGNGFSHIPTLQSGVNPHSYRPNYPQQPQQPQSNNAYIPQSSHHIPSGPIQNFGQGQSSQHAYQIHSAHHPAAYPAHGQGQHQGAGDSFGSGPSPVRARPTHDQTVLQPQPVPRQAAMGLLAMINGNRDLGR